MIFLRAILDKRCFDGKSNFCDLSAKAANEIFSPDGSHSLFDAPNEEPKENDVLKTAAYLVAISPDKWSSSIYGVFLPESSISSIGKISDPESKPLNNIHRNLERCSLSQSLRFLFLIFQNRKSIFSFKRKNIKDLFKNLTRSDWEDIYSGRKVSFCVERANNVKNTFFRNESVPSGLASYLSSLPNS